VATRQNQPFLAAVSILVKHPKWEPRASIAHARICPGLAGWNLRSYRDGFFPTAGQIAILFRLLIGETEATVVSSEVRTQEVWALAALQSPRQPARRISAALPTRLT
jgi:hypothetical protein